MPQNSELPREGVKAPQTGRASEDRTPESPDRFASVSMALITVDLSDQRILAVNAAASRMLGEPAQALVGRRELEFVAPPEWDAVLSAHADVREGRLDGYQSRRTLVPSHGEPFEAEVWVRLLSRSVGDSTALIAIDIGDYDRRSSSTVGFIQVDAGAALMAIIDQEWVIEVVSADSNDVLGVPSPELVGAPFLGLVHSGDAPNFFFAVERVISSGRAVACRLRWRTADHEWWDSVSYVNLLGDESPPRIGIMALANIDAERPTVPTVSELSRSLQRIAAEIRAAQALMYVPEVFGRGRPDDMAVLTSRQLEIVGRLYRGESATAIAEALFLSPSTVRNQLSAVYRRFGVHSQVELLSLFRSTVGDHSVDNSDGGSGQ